MRVEQWPFAYAFVSLEMSGEGYRKKLFLSLLKCSAVNLKLFSSRENGFPSSCFYRTLLSFRSRFKDPVSFLPSCSSHHCH